MSTTTTRADYAQSVYVQEETTYMTAHDAETGTPNLDGASPHCGQKKDANGKYWIYRGFVFFDTSFLTADALIESASLQLYYSSDKSDTDFGVVIRNNDGIAPHNPVQDSDYLYSQYIGNGGSENTSQFNGTKLDISLNSTGKSWINKTGNTIFAIISDKDISATPPDGNEYVLWYGWDNNSYYPRLIITYVTQTGIPVVDDPTYSDIKATYTKATTNVSDTGGGYTERGFEYGISEEATWAVRETGVWGTTGDFSLVLPDLLPLTTYYARAYVTNSYGTGYSDWTSFTTTDVPAYGLYEESNSPTICFYISEDDGKTWGQKHGPYTTDQADIEITKLLVRGSGKKKIKFTSNTLTGISA
ncbi:MAG TPA: hypothetical protein ENG48_08675, partial [Candidatus Atribacteria bacterium]|nr:hypothetical protein [Candidatus Atribacteria bacterium]